MVVPTIENLELECLNITWPKNPVRKTYTDQSSQQFYVQAVPHSTITATENVLRKRPDRPQEVKFDRYFRDFSKVDKRFYQEMISPAIAEAFIQKTKFVCVLLGTNWCVNLISVNSQTL